MRAVIRSKAYGCITSLGTFRVLPSFKHLTSRAAAEAGSASSGSVPLGSQLVTLKIAPDKPGPNGEKIIVASTARGMVAFHSSHACQGGARKFKLDF